MRVSLLFIFFIIFIINSIKSCTITVEQVLKNSWLENGVTPSAQYDMTITNVGPETITTLNVIVSTQLSQFWSATQNRDGSLGLPAWYSGGLPAGQSWGFGYVSVGESTVQTATAPACSSSYKTTGGSFTSGSSSSSNTGGGDNGGSSSSHCSGNPPMFNGLPCASTTRYFDGTTGACGCGVGDDGPYSWQRYSYTAAGSQGLFGAEGGSWCGSGCGSCYEITPTGDCPTGGPCATQTAPIVVMVTNLCPYQYNQEWCPLPGNLNQHGYGAHFDLMDSAQLISNLGWNNPVVTYRQVSCGSLGSPTCSQAGQCKCGTSQCSRGGDVSFTDLNGNVTAPSVPVVASKTHGSKGSWLIAGIAAGIAVVVASVSGLALFILRKRIAPLQPRMVPLLETEYEI